MLLSCQGPKLGRLRSESLKVDEMLYIELGTPLEDLVDTLSADHVSQ